MRLKHLKLVLAALSLCMSAGVFAQSVVEEKVRVLLLTDIGNEPDDSESFVRFLLYANEFDIEGIVATTSTWQRDFVQPELLAERVEAYGAVLPNLCKHADGYPSAEHLQSIIRSGAASFGMEALGPGKDTEASRLIIEVVDRPDPRPVHVSIWGGAADLAQALWTVRDTRTPEEVSTFVSKLRVHSISDQDDTGAWTRRNFPELFWIASVHGWGQYGLATWIGISGDLFRSQGKWPYADMVTNEWLESNIRRGPLGALYPPHTFIMEGDTPSFLGLIPNGLNSPDNPEWGGWGGRYAPIYPGAAHRSDTTDTFVDHEGKVWNGNQATVFRWRGAFQNDFAARMSWTLTTNFAEANHNPQAVLNGVTGAEPVVLETAVGQTVRLSAVGSSDPDGDLLSYRWLYYPEPGQVPGVRIGPISLEETSEEATSFEVPGFQMSNENVPEPEMLVFHIILEVTDSGAPALTTYRRAVVIAQP